MSTAKSIPNIIMKNMVANVEKPLSNTPNSLFGVILSRTSNETGILNRDIIIPMLSIAGKGFMVVVVLLSKVDGYIISRTHIRVIHKTQSIDITAEAMTMAFLIY